jgi:lipoprotein-anchoring transpeptidase ErfK/SrfK
MQLSLSPGATVATVAVGAMLVAGGAVAAVELTGGSSPSSAAARGRPAPRPIVRVAHEAHHHRVPWDRPLTIRVRKGTVRSVVLRGGHSTVAGSIVASGKRWRSKGSHLFPATSYAVDVTVADEAGRTHSVKRRVTTRPAKHLLAGIMSPDGRTVGVGQPVTIHFTAPVPQAKEAAVERRLTVTAKPDVSGAWHWFDDEDVHWRPPHYWKPNTRVTVGMNLSHLYFGHGVWGQPGHHSVGFTVGDALISRVSVPDHWMKVYDNGKLVRTMPISAGSPQYPTMGGVHITLAKSPKVIMDSATVGIPKGSPGYYYETVYWDVRISNGGAFVHAAPWSVADQGNTNVSHGCVNLSPANAQWFYGFSHDEGDIVDIDNPVRGPSSTDPGTEDWNMSWHQWLAGDALHHATHHRRHHHGSGSGAAAG